jgi:hypothetical protein
MDGNLKNYENNYSRDGIPARLAILSWGIVRRNRESSNAAIDIDTNTVNVLIDLQH